MVENQAAILIINYKYDTCLIVSPMSHVEEIKVSEEPKRAIFWWKPVCTPLEAPLETPLETYLHPLETSHFEIPQPLYNDCTTMDLKLVRPT